MHPLDERLYLQLDNTGIYHRDLALRPDGVPPCCPPLTESLFAHRRRYLLWGDVLITSVDVTQPSSLILAHAPRRNPLADLGFRPVQQVFAGCCEPLLGVGGSHRYLHNPCIGAWSHTPS